ncbi:MAG: DUF3084 domain-containing protein [Armatimonadota bacterium]
MDGVATGFIVLMIALGGISAFVADILGYKIGKKRLSLWHIRPKYIARASVTITGMLIPLITVLLLAASSAEFRTWVTRGRKAVQELKQKEDEVQAKNTLLRETNQSLKSSQDLLTNSKKKQEELNKSLEQKKKEAAAQIARADLLKKTIDSQQGQLSRLSSAVSRAESSIRRFQSESVSFRKQSAAARITLDATKSLLSKEQAGLRVIRQSLEATTKQRDAADAAKTQALSDYNNLNARNLDIQKNNDLLTKNLTELRQQLPTLMAEIETLKGDKESANKDLSDLVRQIKDSQDVLEQVRKENSNYAAFSRTSTVAIGKGEELARIIVPSSLTSDEARNLLRSLIRSAKTVAASKGAQPDPAYPFPGEAGLLRIVNRLEIPQSEVEDFWVKQITPSNATRVLVARSTWNRFVGEPVTLDLTFYPNPVVFQQGDVIAEGRADGRNSDIEVFAEIRDFVRVYVNAKAKRVKMVPIQSRDGETFGELDPGQLLSTIRTVRSTNRLLRLQAVARKDIRAGDKLEFDLVVR